MTVIVLLLSILFLDLMGFFFNIRMLLSCFTNREKPEKRANLQKYRVVTIFQFIYQVTTLTMNTIDAFGGLDAQPEESCSVFKAMMVSVNVLSFFNLTATAVIYFRPLVQDTNSQLFSGSLVASVGLALGVIVSLILAWLGCSSYSELLFRASIAGLLTCVVAAFLLCIVWLCSRLDRNHPTQKDFAKITQLRMCLKENKKTNVLIMVMFLCLAVTFSFYADPNLNGTKLILAEFICLLSMNFFVGIALPVYFKDLIESSYIQESEMRQNLVS